MKDADAIKDAQDIYDDCLSREGGNRQNAADDIRFRMGEQWDAQWMRREQRVNLGQSTLQVNQIPQYLNQLINDMRQNRPSVKVRPVDDKSDEDTAEIYDGIIRHAQDVGKAVDARDVAAEHAAVHGLGWYRVKTDYASAMSFDQEPVYQGFDEPWNVYHDDFKALDGSDLRNVLICSTTPLAAFKKQYKGAKEVSWGESEIKDGEDSIILAEHYTIRTRADKLFMLVDGTILLESEAARRVAAGEALPNLSKERPVDVPYVYWCKLSGDEELESRELIGTVIPVFPVIGNVARVDGKVHRWGLIRFAKDPQRYYNFLKSAEVEWIESAAKAQWIGDARSFEPYKQFWALANKVNYGYLPYASTDAENNPLPPPTRNQPVPIPAGILQAEMSATDDIKKSVGMYSAAIGARGNATSGRQELAQQHESDTGTFHYPDNLAKTVAHEGRMLVEWVPKLYGPRKIARILGEDGEASTVRLSQSLPQATTKVRLADKIERVYNLGVGRYDVTVTVGPSFSTKRMEAQAFMTQLAQADPTLMQKAGDIIIRNFDAPGAEMLAKRLKAFLPPQILQAESQEEDQGSPEQLRAAMGQIQQRAAEIQQREQMLQQIDAKMDERDKELDSKAKEVAAELKALAAERKVLDAKKSEIEARLTLATMQARQEIEAAVPKESAPQQDPGEGVKLAADRAVFDAHKRETEAQFELRVERAKRELESAAQAVQAAQVTPEPQPDVSQAQAEAAEEDTEARDLSAIKEALAMLLEKEQKEDRKFADLMAAFKAESERTQKTLLKAIDASRTVSVKSVLDDDGNVIGGTVTSADGKTREVEVS